MEERRKKRKKLSRLDQEFLDHIRGLYQKESGEQGRLGPAQLKRLLRIEDSYLARRIFAVLDRGGAGFIKQSDFLGTVISLILGDNESKLKFVFDLHDANCDGFIDRNEMKRMLDASLRQNEISVLPAEKRELCKAIYRKAVGGLNKRIAFTDFKKLVRLYPEIQREMIGSISEWFGYSRHEVQTRGRLQLSSVFRFLFLVLPERIYKQVLLLLYIAANAYLFWHAMDHYSHLGANIYLQVARGAGACLNLNGALILIPMLRSILSWLRRSFLGVFVPADQSVDIHRLIGEVMFFFALVHTGAHLLNYSTLSVPIQQNLFQSYFGLSGVILLGIFAVMWIFARKRIRRGKGFELFFVSHLLYLAWFAVLLLHARHFWQWGLFSLVGFAVEYYIKRFARRTISYVDKGTALTTGVTHLQIHRPDTFAFQPGDYAFVRIPRISRLEWHPFTISSNPEEKGYLGFHIRSLGNWTGALHRTFSQLSARERRLPVVLNGPYGTPSGRIFKSRTAILVGAGIGVTPFASILKSILYQHEHGGDIKLEKVYFFWLSRGQKSFDWFSELLTEIETKRLTKFMEINIYMTNAHINASTGLVKIGMELVRKQTQRDMTTGLKSVTHFGRPNWDAIF
ncbi:MAG TPA: ferric reductase-like transmembrane domain-containing protein, partial [Spirochaetia bacterium]|nr:ferric reductase-like transmembrane domain-containing protein [Spirochaetia bacterium]